jgi:hypothetical protein
MQLFVLQRIQSSDVLKDARAFLGCDQYFSNGCTSILHFDDRLNNSSTFNKKQNQFAKFIEELKERGISGKEYREQITKWQRDPDARARRFHPPIAANSPFFIGKRVKF